MRKIWTSRFSLFSTPRSEASQSGESTDKTHRYAAEEALDYTRQYYKKQVEIFINNVAVQAVERHLVSTLPEQILSPVIVLQMSDEDVEEIAAEAQETTQRRMILEQQKAMLEKGTETFREAYRASKR